MKWFLLVASILALAFLGASAHAKQTRTLQLNDADVGEIKTAVGYSTILQFDSHPLSAVLGDQDAFKLEYIGNSVTIKPLMTGARSNLFVFTDYERFSFRINTTQSTSADYIVQVKHKPKTPGFENGDSATSATQQKVTVKNVQKTTTENGISLELGTLMWPKNHASLLITFSIFLPSGSDFKELNFSAGDLEIEQGGAIVPIDSLSLDALKLSESARTVKGTITLKGSDFKSSLPLYIQFSPIISEKRHRLRLSIPITNKKEKSDG